MGGVGTSTLIMTEAMWNPRQQVRLVPVKKSALSTTGASPLRTPQTGQNVVGSRQPTHPKEKKTSTTNGLQDQNIVKTQDVQMYFLKTQDVPMYFINIKNIQHAT